MSRLFAGMVLSVVILLLSGCYVQPGYGYVRQTVYQGGAYYGEEPNYYAAPYYGPYDYYGYGCCYAPGIDVGIGAVWYGRTHYYRYGRPEYRRYGHAPGYWRGAPGRAGPGPHPVEHRGGGHWGGGHWGGRGHSNGY